ncbi:hypothetical protein P350_11325 [Burkholderia cepacia JBK9]|nr:hypothetical protein P350_11325 [Burkholderia cepacia JBK9]
MRNGVVGLRIIIDIISDSTKYEIEHTITRQHFEAYVFSLRELKFPSSEEILNMAAMPDDAAAKISAVIERINFAIGYFAHLAEGTSPPGEERMGRIAKTIYLLEEALHLLREATISCEKIAGQYRAGEPSRARTFKDMKMPGE